MFNRNEDIKEAIGSLPRWCICEKLSIHENTLYRWMRQELSEEKKQMILVAIKEVKDEMNREAEMY
ncbi:hypothetical protein [Bacillus sp. Hm123]|uniref:hypothetical protein n=1 Tax=Bacillus sp. Hm123 TaxID=3450745 RepID=UPI003F4394F9